MLREILEGAFFEGFRSIGRSILDLKKERDRAKVLRMLCILERIRTRLGKGPLPIDHAIRILEREGFERKLILEAIRIGYFREEFDVKLSLRIQSSLVSIDHQRWKSAKYINL